MLLDLHLLRRLRPALGFGLHVILDLVHEVLQKVQDAHFLVDIP